MSAILRLPQPNPSSTQPIPDNPRRENPLNSGKFADSLPQASPPSPQIEKGRVTEIKSTDPDVAKANHFEERLNRYEEKMKDLETQLQSSHLENKKSREDAQAAITKLKTQFQVIIDRQNKEISSLRNKSSQGERRESNRERHKPDAKDHKDRDHGGGARL